MVRWNDAAARKIALYHYDPSYEDTTIDEMLKNARQHNAGVIASREGLELTI